MTGTEQISKKMEEVGDESVTVTIGYTVHRKPKDKKIETKSHRKK